MAERYDAGLLSTNGGGDVDWWQDYIRAELDRAHDFYDAEIARLRAMNAEMEQALSLHQAWADSESAGPDYGGQTRDTHPDGERIWRDWWEGNLSLCDRAMKATKAALAKARGGDGAQD